MHPTYGMKRMVENWTKTRAGQRVIGCERQMVRDMLPELHGYYLLQYSGVGEKLLESTTLEHDFYVSQNEGGSAQIDYCHLPFRENTLDAVVLHHVLDYVESPHQALREAARVVVPNGYLVVIGFNPWSLCGVRRRFSHRKQGLWRGNHISLARLKDWMALLGFRDERHGYGQYFFPLFRGMPVLTQSFDQILGRTGLPLGGVYVVVARKLVAGMTPIRPKWRPLPSRGLSVATPTTRGARVSHRRNIY